MAEDIIKILEEAIEKEKQDMKKYRKLAEEARDPEARAVFEQLASDEQQHAKVLKERLNAVKLMKKMGLI